MTSFQTRAICLACYRELGWDRPERPRAPIVASQCFLCKRTTTFGLVVYLSNDMPAATVKSPIQKRLDDDTWPADISLTYQCPSCGDEIDLREADAL